MGSNKLFLSSVHGHISGRASGGYTCSEKYEWQNLTLHQSEQAAREQPHHVAILRCPLHMSSRVQDSVTATEISRTSRGCYDLQRTEGELVNNRCRGIAMCGVKRMGKYTALHGHGHSSEIHGPGNGVGGPCHLSCYSYGGCHGQDHVCLSHSSKKATCSISAGPSATRPYRSERRPSSDHLHYAKEVHRLIGQAGSCRNIFSEIDAAKHRSYMRSFHFSNKHEGRSEEDPTYNIAPCTSHGRSHQRDETVRAHPKRPFDEFHPIHHEQLELSPNEDFLECLDSSQNFRNTYNGKTVKRKCIKQGFQNSCNVACASRYGRNSSLKRNAEHFDGKKARKDVAYKDKSKRFCYPNEQGQQLLIESENMRNDSWEGNTEISKLVDQNGAKGNYNLKKNALTAPVSSGSTKCDENLNISLRYSTKNIASSNIPKLSEGSNNMELESDMQLNVDGCTKRGIIQHLPVTHTDKSVQPKESDNLSRSEVLRRDCLNLWRARQLRKDSAAGADEVLKVDQQQTAQRSKVSTGRRVRNGRPAACASSESDDGDDIVSECSDQFSIATSSEGLQKCGEGRANKNLEWPHSFSSNRICNKRPRNTTADKSLKLPPEANPGDIAQLKEHEKLLNRRQLSTDHPDDKVHTSWNGCSDASKVDKAAVSHCDDSAHQDISQLEANNANLDAGKKVKRGLKCEQKAERHGTKWAKQITSLYTDPTLLDQKTITGSLDGELKVNSLETPSYESGSTPFDGLTLDRGTANMCQKKPVNRSSQSYCRDFKIWLDGNDCRDNQRETMNHNILRKKQECSVLADSENESNDKSTKDDCQPQACRVEITSNQQITTEDTSDTINSVAAKRGDLIPCSSIPDLNFLPSMISDENFVAPEEPVCQVTGPVMKEEQFKLAEPNQVIREVCETGTSEATNQLQISDSNTGPPSRSTVEESSTSIDAFKSALCEFIKNIIKPLWEDGLLSREVHKIIVKKAVEKVAGAWASNAPSTEMDIRRILSDESKNIEKLVQGYLDVYVGREVLKRTIPGSC